MAADVHPQIQAILDRISQLGLEPLSDMTVEAGRARVEAMAQASQEAFPPAHVALVDTTTTGAGYGDVPVRIYRASANANAPAILYFHGGGHVICSLDTHDRIARSLASRTRCTVISVDYRLAPEHPFPAAVSDSFNAFQWACAQSEKLSIDRSRIAVCGDSAGANLATVVALLAREQGTALPCAQVLVYPVIDYRGGTPSSDRYATGYGALTAETMRWFLECYLPDASVRDDWRACPSRAELTPDLPPTLILVAQCDILRDEGVRYGAQLRKAGVSVQVEEFPGMIHGFFDFLGEVDAANDAHETVSAFLTKQWL